MCQIMCSPFWPNESVHSSEYGQLAVTFVSTTPKPDWEMTVLQVADKNRVSSAEVLYSMYVHKHSHFTIQQQVKWQNDSLPRARDPPWKWICSTSYPGRGRIVLQLTQCSRWWGKWRTSRRMSRHLWWSCASKAICIAMSVRIAKLHAESMILAIFRCNCHLQMDYVNTILFTDLRYLRYPCEIIVLISPVMACLAVVCSSLVWRKLLEWKWKEELTFFRQSRQQEHRGQTWSTPVWVIVSKVCSPSKIIYHTRELHHYCCCRGT